jgi:protoporphyrin/coproporphyrin ferrochelatase
VTGRLGAASANAGERREPGSLAGGSAAGVVLMAYGTPRREEDIEAYYTDIRRGRPPSAEQLADLRKRYQAIGGLSPLAEISAAQSRGVQAALDRLDPGRYSVAVGTKHASPSIEEAVDKLSAAGARELIGVVLAPHFSALSVGGYASRAETASRRHGMAFAMIESWHLDLTLLELLAERVRRTVEALGAPDTRVVFTAHSLPARVLDMGDPYPAQVFETASAVARLAGVSRWSVAWQSAGATPEPWLSPDLRDVLVSLADEGADAVAVCPAGFTADHLEVLYDVDIDAAGVAASHGVRLARTPSLNDDPRFVEALARLVAGARGDG